MRQYLSNGNNSDQLSIKYGMLSGATAGLCQVVATNPMEIVKIRMQLTGLSLSSTVRSLGVYGLYKGSLATLCRDVPFSLVFFPLVSLFKIKLTGPDQHHKLWPTFIAGISAGSIAAALVTPMDVVKTRLQRKYQGEAPYKGIRDCWSKIIKEEGVGALFKGVVPRVFIVSPLFAITVLVYEMQQRYFNKE